VVVESSVLLLLLETVAPEPVKVFKEPSWLLLLSPEPLGSVSCDRQKEVKVNNKKHFKIKLRDSFKISTALSFLVQYHFPNAIAAMMKG
jgi:hypothetical protein